MAEPSCIMALERTKNRDWLSSKFLVAQYSLYCIALERIISFDLSFCWATTYIDSLPFPTQPFQIGPAVAASCSADRLCASLRLRMSTLPV